MKRLLILDSNSIINRAYYGVRYLSTSDGIQTNALYGFLSIFAKLVDTYSPDYVCAAFDLKAPTFRHKMYQGYKAQRKPMPDELAVQMPFARDLVRAMNIPLFEIEGFEADDIIGTVSRLCEEKGIECLIATGDKDDLQLASDKTKVALTVSRMGQTDTQLYDDEAVKEKYGVTPLQFIDMKALMGDASDNIPGVKGIGEKTAQKLISECGSIEYIYDHIDEIGLKGATLAKMKDGRDMAFLSKTLATIDKNVPIDFDAEKCAFSSVSEQATDDLYPLLKKLELNSIIKRFGLEATQSDNIESEDIFKDINIQTVSSLPCADNMAYIIDYTTGGVCISDGINAYVLDSSADTENELKRLFDGKNLISSDLKNDIINLPHIGELYNVTDDVSIAAYLAEPSRSDYSIEKLCMHYFKTELVTPTASQLSLFDAEEEDNIEYMAKCAVAVFKLKEKLSGILSENGQLKLYEEVEIPLCRVLAHMQMRGFLVDRDALVDFSDKLKERVDILTEEIYALAGEEFNINSPKQLGEILFTKLGLKNGKKTKTGYSTNVEVLEKLSSEHPIIEKILEYRHIAKLKSTYCDGITPLISPKTNRIHSVFNQTVTVTGRISSTEPNMQNIPVRTELGREIRRMFVAEDDYILVDADYSQIELRVLASIANDENMINAFLGGEDIHAVTAANVLDIPLSEVTPDQRRSAKAINFGIVYGMGAFSLSQDLKISVKQADEYIKSYLDKYSGVREYMQAIKEKAKVEGKVTTLLNRIRYIPELKSTNHQVRMFGERVALNTPIQGTAADIIKLAMIRVDQRLMKENLKSRLILQVHDELIVEAHKDEVETVKNILREEMEGAMQIKVPLIVDMAVGHSWYDTK